ncbi:uncharacterized protein LOC142979450 [Anticarsia gemmatalis]|uniref:uncharacterized protein LOC142979450 n=1 Tax=Anticarsia gemmatalis TaxID=129554 RepID=UPI003F771748
MFLYYLMFAVVFNAAVCEALFFWKEKPIFLCFKVCPLYCAKNSKRRLDEDKSSLIYIDREPPKFEPEFWVEDYPDHPPPYYFGHWVHPTTKKPVPTTTTTTTMAPTTTEEPTYICVVCEKKCGYRGKR